MPGEGWPRGRRLALFLAVLFAAFAVYGSLVPFETGSITIRDAWLRFAGMESVTSPTTSKTDLLSNVLLFMPIGICLAAVIQYRRSGIAFSIVCLAVIGVLGVVFSAAIEFAQTFIPARVPSAKDIVAEGAGAVSGGLLWVIAGSRLAAHAARIRASEPEAAPFLFAFVAYVGTLAIVQWSPFDATLRPAELLEKYRRGWISLGFLTNGFSLGTLSDAAAPLAMSLPLGWLAARTCQLWRAPQCTVYLPLLISWGVILGAEMGQVLVVSRMAHLQAVWTGVVGASAGVYVAWRAKERTCASAKRSSVASPLAGAMVWSAVFLAWAWRPFDWVLDPALVRNRLPALIELPLKPYFAVSPIDALTDAAAKVLFPMPLGALLATAWPISKTTWLSVSREATIVAGVAGIHFIAELGQAFLPSRYPSSTDILLGVVGGVIGLRIGAALRQPRSR